jgi:hypothetical protein
MEKLKPGEIVCEECKGTGYDLKVPDVEDQYTLEYRRHYKCDKCHGVGKFDWIEVIVGKKPKPCFIKSLCKEHDYSHKFKPGEPEWKTT